LRWVFLVSVIAIATLAPQPKAAPAPKLLASTEASVLMRERSGLAVPVPNPRSPRFPADALVFVGSGGPGHCLWMRRVHEKFIEPDARVRFSCLRVVLDAKGNAMRQK
jgi:hypothetical protein